MTLGLTTQDAVVIKEFKYSDYGCLITLCYFRNNSPRSISSLFRYWVINNILYGVNLVHWGINL